jgi:hypothetical protein
MPEHGRFLVAEGLLLPALGLRTAVTAGLRRPSDDQPGFSRAPRRFIAKSPTCSRISA